MAAISGTTVETLDLRGLSPSGMRQGCGEILVGLWDSEDLEALGTAASELVSKV